MLLAYDSGFVYMCGTNEDGSIFKDKIESNNLYAIGSMVENSQLAAMDLGKSAVKDAVEAINSDQD